MFKIAEECAVEASGLMVRYLPRFWLNGITVSPHRDGKGRERLLSRTFGSVDWLWSGDDEVRFLSATGQLESFVLTAPEVATGTSCDPHPLLLAPCRASGLKAHCADNFGFEPMDARWVSDDGKHLVCVRQDHLSRMSSYRRLRVARDVDFIFGDGELCAWALHNPARYLVHRQEMPEDEPSPPGLHRALRNYLSLFVEPNIDAMQEGDPKILHDLERLQCQLRDVPQDPRRDVLISRVNSFCDEWYGWPGWRRGGK